MTAGNTTSQVRFLLSDNPFYTNDDLYRLTNAVTLKEKNTVRKAKERVLDVIHNKQNLSKLKNDLPINEKKYEIPKDFSSFIETAFPPFGSLYKWQYDLFTHLEENEISLVIAPRDHGKSVLITYYVEYIITVKKMDVLLLGWTDRVKQMAMFIYTYFLRMNLVTDEAVIKNTSNHFVTKDGIRFDCYGLKEKAILGMHPDIYESKAGLCLIVDDPIDESFEMYKSKERDLEARWESTIANINPNKLIISGTRKFEGDFLEYFAKRYEERVHIFFRTPILEDGTLLCPERWTEEKLALKRAEIGEYRYSSEYLGDPQPLTGGVWIEDDLHYASKLKKYSEYDSVCIAVDPAWTTEPDSANTSIEIVFKGKETEGKRKYIVFHDISGKFTFNDILNRIETNFKDIQEQFKGLQIVVAIEDNGGGKILIDIAESRNYTFSPHILRVHSTRAKEERIMVLEVPIKNGTIEFMEDLKEGELIYEILTFPKCKKFDAVDALSMGFTELEKMRKRNFVIYRKKWY